MTHARALRVEASHRQFYRISTNQRSLVLMSSPPELERNDTFLAMANLFRRAGIAVPQIYAENLDAGFFLMQDFGSVHIEDVYAKSAAVRDSAISACIDVLAPFGKITDPQIEIYSASRMYTEMGIFDEWFVGHLLEHPVDAVGRPECDEHLVAATQEQPQACVHRDFHCRNLLLAENGTIGIVDFQDALHGPILYDIASLLRDCYYVFSENEVDRWLDYFIAQSPGLTAQRRDQIKLWFDFTAIQRQIKAIGIFARLHLRDQKSSHLPHILPVLRRLVDLTAQYPQLGALHSSLMLLNKHAAQNQLLTQQD